MGRPPSRAGLDTAVQREICWWLAKGLSKDEAARRVGLSTSIRVHAFARTREFASALREALVDHMANDLSPKAVKILDEIMSDRAVTPRVRVDAAKALLDRSGYGATPSSQAHTDDATLNELSIDQLRRLVETLEDARSAAAKPVERLPTLPAPTLENLIG